jgi:ribose/xylose/arabinose/galactoside ABC-type transport system permease subunit
MIARASGLLRRHKESGLNVLLVFVAVQILCIAGALLFPDSFRYLSPANISVQFKAIPVLGIMALGVGVLMIAGEFDLSVGANYTITAVVLASLVQQGWSVYVATPLVLALGVLIGLLNGFITLRFHIPSFIATLGAMLFWKGTTLLYNGATALRFRPDLTFVDLTAGNFGLIEAAFVWFVVLSLVFFSQVGQMSVLRLVQYSNLHIGQITRRRLPMGGLPRGRSSGGSAANGSALQAHGAEALSTLFTSG